MRAVVFDHPGDESAFQRRFGTGLENGSIRPIVNRVLPFDRAAEAHRLVAAGKIFGKLILTRADGER